MKQLRIGVSLLLAGLSLVPPAFALTETADHSAPEIRLPAKQTYAASTVTKLTVSSAANAVFANVCGSATRTVRVRQILVDYTVATAAVHQDIILQKTSTAATGGTATALTAVPLDSKYLAATATANAFTSTPPTTGTVVGVVSAQMKWAQVTGTVTGGSASPYPFLYRPYSETDAVVLRGTAECVQAAFATAPGNTATYTFTVMWTEEKS